MNKESDTTQIALVTTNNKEISPLKPGRTFVGNGVALDLEPDVHTVVATQIHAFLLDNPDTMELVSEADLVKNMREGKTVLKLGDNNELLGFARLSEDKLAEGIYDPTTIVVGTWIGVRHPEYANGSGAWAMENAAELALTSLKFPGALQVMTRVQVDNQGPQNMLKRYDDQVEEVAKGVLSPKTGKPVIVYDVTKLGRSRMK